MLKWALMFLIPDDSWEVKKTIKKGRGLFARTDIVPGTIIGDYLGKIVSPAEENEIDEKDNFYLMYYHDRASIFPDLKKPGIHLLNHSCTPNTWMYTYKGHTLFFTLRKIFRGEELTVNYLLSPQDDSCTPCTHLCFCEGVICHQTMHLGNKKYERWSAFHDKQMKRTKPERIRYGKDLPPLSSYPTSFPDEAIYDLFGSKQAKPEILKDKKLPANGELRKKIRETGRILSFSALDLAVLGITDGLIISENITT
jgi:uncharacterized protein